MLHSLPILFSSDEPNIECGEKYILMNLLIMEFSISFLLLLSLAVSLALSLALSRSLALSLSLSLSLARCLSQVQTSHHPVLRQEKSIVFP